MIMSEHVCLRFADRVGPWHKFFAWKPVTTYDQRKVWLRRAWRACYQKHHYLIGGADFWFVYSIEPPTEETS